MKKQLLATSALVAAGMIAASGSMIATTGEASAQTAPASQPIQVTVGGYMYQFFSYTDQDNRTQGASGSTATATPTKFNQQADSEIIFQGKTTLANGISVAINVQLEGNTEGDQIDESFASIEGAFGRIELGSTDHAGMKTSVGAPGDFISGPTVTGYATLVGSVVANSTDSSNVNSTFGSTILRFGDNDSQRISYYTPRFEGFQAGVSYTPERNSQDRATVTYDENSYRNGVGAGLNFTRAFGGLDVQASLGYSKFEKPKSQTAGATFRDPKAYNVGLQLGYAGFRIGGRYAKFKDGFTLTGGTAGAGAAFAGSGVTGVSDFVDDGRAYELGVQYTFGPAEVGLTYFNGKNKATTTNSADDKNEIVALHGRYTLGPGVRIFATGYAAEVKGEGTTLVNGADVDNNKAAGVITGLILNF